MSNSMTSAQQIMQWSRLLLPEALLVFHCNKGAISAFLASFKGYSSVDTTEQCEEVVVKVREALVPELGCSSSGNSRRCSSAAASGPEELPGSSNDSWRILLESRVFKPHSVSVLCFAAERLPRTFSGSTCLIRCKIPAHLPCAGNLLTLAEKAAPAGLGPFGALPWSSYSGAPAAQRGKQNFHVVFLFEFSGKSL